MSIWIKHADHSTSDHISDVCRSTYLSLRRIGSIRHLLTDKAAICLVNALTTSRLDFCNSTLAGINVDQVYRLQRLQNAAARLVTKKRKHDHISPVLLAFCQGLAFLFVKNIVLAPS